MSITIKDIARLVGVSTATVSKALNNKKDISEDLKKRIKETAKELGYIKNSCAAKLASQKSNTIAVFIRPDSSNYNLFIEILEAANKKNYDVMAFTNKSKIIHNKTYMEICCEKQLVGAVILGFRTEHTNLYTFESLPVPLCFINSAYYDKQELYASRNIQNEIGKEVISSLLELIENRFNYSRR